MAIRPIISLPDPRLRQRSDPVARVDDEVRELMDDMLETMYDAPGVGLAAIQIGVPKRVVVIDTAKEGEENRPLFLANPEIVWSSDETRVYQEGCLSIPDFLDDVERPERVRLRFLDRNGEPQEIEADGLLATALQHEVDHLNGVLFIDYLSRLKRERVTKKFAKLAKRENDGAGDAPASNRKLMRVVFMGTPQFAVPALSAIVGHGHEVVAVYTRAPQPAGRRGLELTPSPVQRIAEQFRIPVMTPRSLREQAAVEPCRSHDADIAVVVAYGLILPAPILAAPVHGCLNLHASLLPRWRGAAPIQRAIMAGDKETGVMVMQMDEGLDTGPVSLGERVAIAPDATAGEMHDRLSDLGADLIARALSALARDCLMFHAQASTGITYAQKISKQECRIAWGKPARQVHDHIRGLSPSPGAFFEVDLGRGLERIKVLRSLPAERSGAPGTVLDDSLLVACGEGAVRLLALQRAGKAPMDATTFLNGARLPAGIVLN